MYKQDIQPFLDDLVKKSRESGTYSTFMGVPVSEFTKEELIAILDEIGRTYEHRIAEKHRSMGLLLRK